MTAIHSPPDCRRPSTSAAVQSKIKHAIECLGELSESNTPTNAPPLFTGTGYIQPLQDPDPNLTELQNQNLKERDRKIRDVIALIKEVVVRHSIRDVDLDKVACYPVRELLGEHVYSLPCFRPLWLVFLD